MVLKLGTLWEVDQDTWKVLKCSVEEEPDGLVV
jgi:hypothetical protein